MPKSHRYLALFLFTLILCTASCCGVTMAKRTEDGKWAFVPLADGFDYPVGKPDAKNYYKARGIRFKTPRHLGEDWNGIGGGNTDLGDPVYTIGHGLVTYAADAKGRWGKIVIVRHAYREPKLNRVICVQTLYSHLDRIDVQLGQIVMRGDQVGTIGTNNGMYPAHLHAELHYNVLINCGQQGVPKTPKNYGHLTNFIKKYRKLPNENKWVKVPIGGFLPYKNTVGL